MLRLLPCSVEFVVHEYAGNDRRKKKRVMRELRRLVYMSELMNEMTCGAYDPDSFRVPFAFFWFHVYGSGFLHQEMETRLVKVGPHFEGSVRAGPSRFWWYWARYERWQERHHYPEGLRIER